MATNHYDYNRNVQPGAEQNDCLRQLSAAWDRFRHLRGLLITKKVIGGSGDTEFTAIATEYAYPDSATASAAFGQIDSAFGNGDAAITQMLDRLL